jgi:hypothetical protein
MLLHRLKIGLVVISCLTVWPTLAGAKPSERLRVLALCDQLYGPVIDQRLKLYAVNQFFVLNLIFDRRDHLVGLHVEPKWYYDWYNFHWEARDDFRNLSKSEFESLLADIDRLKPKGTLIKAASPNPEIRNLTAWRRETYAGAELEWGEVADPQQPPDAPLMIRWFNVFYVEQRAQHSKSMDRSGGSVFLKMKGATKVEWNRGARSTAM